MMGRHPHDLAHHLSREAEAVCRYYLSNGRRQGSYWMVGDARNTPGRSMFVRLIASRKGSAGKWTDAATGQHGDLLDIIRESCGRLDFRDVADEARRFLNLPRSDPAPSLKVTHNKPLAGSPWAAARLFAMAQPVAGTLAESYLRKRGIAALVDDVLTAGEGIETILSPRCTAPAMPMAAALSANHLAALLLPLTLRRIYIARDADAAGDLAVAALTERAMQAGIETIALSPRLSDFNEDLQTFGLSELRSALQLQFTPQDAIRFIGPVVTKWSR